MSCPNCATPTRAGARFCPRCGLWLETQCPRCGSELTALAIFCDRCGTQVSALPGVSALAGPVIPAAPAAAVERPAIEPAAVPVPRPAAIPRELAAKLEAARSSGEMVGERRIVTMLFCDMKGSTAAAEGLDPEDWTEIMNGAFEHMIRPVYTYEGTLARLMGDALLAFFGAPLAHEDDPQRAVLAALDIVAGMQPYREAMRQRWGVDINVRVGINTGLVVVGAVGSDLRVEYSALGDAINLAARMEQTAAPGTVQIAHDTYRHVRQQFDCEPLGGIEVKGKSEPVLAYRVLGRRAVAGRTRGIEGLHAAMVGREAELQALSTVLAGLQQGVGGIVCVLGEAGLGKSRLVSEARQAYPHAEAVEWIETGSLSYESSQAYGLFQRLMQRVLGLEPSAPAPQVRATLADLVAGLPPERQAGAQAAFETLFGLEADPGRAALTGETFRRELLEAVRAWWRARWWTQPAVLVFDDMHWCDAASVDLLCQLVALIEEMPLVMMGVLRTERQAPAWRLRTLADDELHHRYTELTLRPLSAAESSELVNRLLAIAELPDQLRERILEKTGGNPFFVEEVVRTLIDSGAVVAEDRPSNGRTLRYWRASSDGADFAIPDNLQALMSARMDRLDEATRSTLQVASVIGRSFYYRVLARLAADPAARAELDRHLSALVRTEMILEAARVPEVEYKFRNPLMQEATYRTILHKRRREFHQRVGEAMEALFPERLVELAPRLGYHFAEGGDQARALHYFTLAGDRSAQLYANQEALMHYDRALALAMALPPGAAASSQLIHLFTSKGRTLELSSQHAEALSHYQRMEAWSIERGDQALELAALAAQGTLYSTASALYNLERSLALAQRSLDLACALGDGAAEAKILWNLMNVHRFTDQMDQAVSAGERSLALARALDLREQIGYTLNDLFYVYQAVGRTRDALDANREARGLWRELGNRAMLADNLSASVAFEIFGGQLEDGLANAAEALAISREIGNIWGIAFSQQGVAVVHWMRGDFEQAMAALETTITYGDRASFLVGPLWARAQLAMVYGWLGQPERGRAVLAELRKRMPAMAKSTPAMAISLAYLTHAYLATGELGQAEAVWASLEGSAEAAGMPKELLGWAQVALRLAQRDYDQALALAEHMLGVVRASHTNLLVPDLLLALGRARAGLGQVEPARAALHAARGEAEALQLRWASWQVLAELAPLERARGDEATAQACLGQAQALLADIAERAGSDDLRESFLARPEVRAIMGA